MGFKQWQKKKKQGLPWCESKDGGFSSRPPPVPRNSFDSVPNWERRFCSQMSWRDFCYKKRAIHLYLKELDWDDSAGKEAFENSKARFWAEINGLPCKIPSPDPDLYIDEIDYDAPVDLQLYEDVYKMPPPPPCKVEIPDLSSITPTGWDVLPQASTDNIPEFIFIPETTTYPSIGNSTLIEPTGWGDEEGSDLVKPLTVPNHTADNSAPVVPTGWAKFENSLSTHARVFPEIQLNGAFTINDGNLSSLKHHHKTNARSRGGVSFKHTNQRWSEQFYEMDISFGSKHATQRHKSGNSSFVSKPVNQRCNGQVSEMDKYAKEQYFWHHDTSFDRRLSTGFHGGDNTLY